MKKTDIILMTGLIGAILFSNAAGFRGTVNGIEDSVLRMHILANSDSDEDQQLKLKVRDRLLESSEEIFSGCSTLSETEAAARENIAVINGIVNGVIKENGFDYKAETSIVSMDFDERVYGSITMPAGSYKALRVTIGEAQGHNWWCVMYPPLCIPVAEKNGSDAAEDYFTSTELDMMENPGNYRIGFKCAELLRGLKNKISEIF